MQFYVECKVTFALEAAYRAPLCIEHVLRGRCNNHIARMHACMHACMHAWGDIFREIVVTTAHTQERSATRARRL